MLVALSFSKFMLVKFFNTFVMSVTNLIGIVEREEAVAASSDKTKDKRKILRSVMIYFIGIG